MTGDPKTLTLTHRHGMVPVTFAQDDPEIMRELWRKLHEVMHAQGVQSDFPALEAERGEK